MKAKNQIVIISGILALLVTATIASYSVQTVKAAFGKDVVSGLAQSQVKGFFWARYRWTKCT